MSETKSSEVIQYDEWKEAAQSRINELSLNSAEKNNLENLLSKFKNSDYQRLLSNLKKDGKKNGNIRTDFVALYIDEGEVIKHTLSVISIIDEIAWVYELYVEPQEERSFFNYSVTKSKMNQKIKPYLNKGEEFSNPKGFLFFSKEKDIETYLLYEPFILED